jgi:DNA mismatch repair ATPase MutS
VRLPCVGIFHDSQLLDAPSLSLRSSPAHGLHVHLAKAKRDRVKLDGSPSFITISESASTKCYFNKVRSPSLVSYIIIDVSQQWSQLGSQIAETSLALVEAEKEAFEVLRAEVCVGIPCNRSEFIYYQINLYATALRRNARILDELDIAVGFANLAVEMNFVRPVLTNEYVLYSTNEFRVF